jgi:hypothetical protein
MQVGFMYAVKIYESEIGECMLKKWDDRNLSCTFFYLDGNGELSEHSTFQTINFQLELLVEMRKMKSRYLEIDDFVEHLRNYRLIERYDLATLANIVALGIHDAVYNNHLREHDKKHGTSLRSFISVHTIIEKTDVRNYSKLLRFVANEIRSGQVTMNWALLQFEKECGLSVIQVLFDAEKSFEQFAADAILHN